LVERVSASRLVSTHEEHEEQEGGRLSEYKQREGSGSKLCEEMEGPLEHTTLGKVMGSESVRKCQIHAPLECLNCWLCRYSTISLQLYCREFATAPRAHLRYSPLILSAVVLRRACHPPLLVLLMGRYSQPARAPPMLFTGSLCCYTARACSRPLMFITFLLTFLEHFPMIVMLKSPCGPSITAESLHLLLLTLYLCPPPCSS